MYRYWDSLAEFSSACSQLAGLYHESEKKWAGGTMATVSAKCLDGDDSLVGQAEALLDKLSIDCDIQGTKWVHSVSGAYPCVPDYLSGSPTPMRRRKRVTSDIAPVKIFVSTTCSVHVSEETMLNRGVAILALLIKLQQVRPVELFLVGEQGDGYDDDGFTLQSVRIESKPLNMSTACYALARFGVSRQMFHTMSKKLNGFICHFPPGYKTPEYDRKRAGMLGLTPQDIWIDAARTDDPMITQPIAWLQSRLDAYMSPQEVSE